MNDEEKMRNLRREYESETMSEEGVEQMREKIEQAKQEHKRIEWSKVGRTAVGIAAAAAVVVTVVNLSPSVSRAMSGIPVIGDIVKVISFRVKDYTKNEDNSLTVRIPELKKNDSHGERKRMYLKDLYGDKTDTFDAISENIKEQMRSRMAEDSMVKYWLDDPEMPEDNFQGITGDTQFYINEDGQLVIVFQEGDVAPMYMGIEEFIIPEGVADWK